jgi:predicted HicB family RNase H-like nuclease
LGKHCAKPQQSTRVFQDYRKGVREIRQGSLKSLMATYLLRMPLKLKQKCQIIANKQQTSLALWIVQVLEKEIKNHE